MAVQNRIIKIQKRNRALVTFDPGRICLAILRAAESIGGFKQDLLPDINGRILDSCGSDYKIASFMADAVIICLNADEQHLIANFPPTIESIQDKVIHVLRSYGLQNTADAYACYRWGRHWLRENAITPDQFAGNGFPKQLMSQTLMQNAQYGCDSVAGLNQVVRAGKIKPVIDESIARYEASLDEAAKKVMSRINGGDDVRIMWVSGPSSSGKTTTTVKLTQRLEKEGLRFLMLNLDDYFWSLVEHPTDWINDRNFETPEALDIQLLNEHLRMLLDGQTIEKPTYSFKEGRRTAPKSIKLEPDQILLLDCLHGLYPPMTAGIHPKQQFKLYIEAMNVMWEGDGGTKTFTKFTDVRLIRRMLRDVQHRNYRPITTILHWHYVRAGELFSIIPLMGLADHIVNGGFPFDLAALKPFFSGEKSYLPTADEFVNYAGFLDARIRYERIKQLLDAVEGLSREAVAGYELIPGDALIREFVGNGTIKIPHNE